MSNPIKAIGKAFKSVVKVVKKIALPALAIGAVALTGGAALGVLPALGGAGGLLASVGIKGALAGILTSAAKAATFGAIGSALTGGNIIDGAKKGLLIGGAIGGLGALTGASAAAGAGAEAAQQTAQGATDAVSAGADAASTASSALPPVSAGSSFSEAFAPLANGGGGLGTNLAAASPVAASAPAVASMAAPATQAVTSSGGIGGFFGNMHPMVQGQLIQGIGAGISANEDAKDARRVREERRANYEDLSGLFTLDRSRGLGNVQPAAQRYDQAIYGRSRLMYDPATGQVVPVGG